MYLTEVIFTALYVVFLSFGFALAAILAGAAI